VAIHINAFNFPVWGMLEKLAPTLLAGMPAIVKPASATAYLAEAAFRVMLESGVLPTGAVQLIVGGVGDLFDHLTGQDVVSFTGSASTALKLRTHPAVIRESVRFIAEHYNTSWDQGQLLGTRTISSNPVHAFFWNNINWHIGHHIYPRVPWYNLIELHQLLKGGIEDRGGIIDKSYTAVFIDALRHGPETTERLAARLDARRRVD